MKKWLVALSLATVVHRSAAAEEAVVRHTAYLSAGTLLSFCSANKSDPDQNAKMQACYAFVMGVNDAILDLYTGRTEPMPYCMPLLKTPGELVAIIKPSLETHRSDKEMRAATIVREQLIKAFPCSD